MISILAHASAVCQAGVRGQATPWQVGGALRAARAWLMGGMLAAAVARGASLPLYSVSAPGLTHALHYYFHQSPESPDGRRVAYSSLRANDNETDVFVCAPDGTDQRKVATVRGKVSMHMGAAPFWLGANVLAFTEGGDRVHLLDLAAGTARVMAGAISDYSAANGLICFRINQGDSSALLPGIYVLDPKRGTPTRLIGPADVKELAAAMKVTRAVELWRFDHPLWSPNGKRMIFELKTGPTSRSMDDFLLVADADGSGRRLFGPKPMHPGWWDDDLIFGHDWAHRNDKNFKLWTADGKIAATVAGEGCHGAVSPDREWIATESWYGSDPIVLRLFRRGQVQPAAILYVQQERSRELWKLRTHVHPAFSRDGRRVYFNAWPENAPGPQVMAVDISAVQGNGTGSR